MLKEGDVAEKIFSIILLHYKHFYFLSLDFKYLLPIVSWFLLGSYVLDYGSSPCFTILFYNIDNLVVGHDDFKAKLFIIELYFFDFKTVGKIDVDVPNVIVSIGLQILFM